MGAFDFFRPRTGGYVPRTPAAALKAIAGSGLPAEHFIYASTSAKPLDEEPFDLEALERILGRPDLPPASSLQLKRVLGKLVGAGDQETALFGAEGITAIESRALDRIERLRGRLARTEDRAVRWRLAREYRDLGQLHEEAASVRVFYLRKAYAALRGPATGGTPGSRRITLEDLSLAVDILVALGMHGTAARLLERAPQEDTRVLWMTAGVAFHRKRYRTVGECCRRLKAAVSENSGTAEMKRVISAWADNG